LETDNNINSLDISKKYLMRYIEFILEYGDGITTSLLHTLASIGINFITPNFNSIEINDSVRTINKLDINNIKIYSNLEIEFNESIYETNIDLQYMQKMDFYPIYDEQHYNMIKKLVKIV